VALLSDAASGALAALSTVEIRAERSAWTRIRNMLQRTLAPSVAEPAMALALAMHVLGKVPIPLRSAGSLAISRCASLGALGDGASNGSGAGVPGSDTHPTATTSSDAGTGTSAALPLAEPPAPVSGPSENHRDIEGASFLDESVAETVAPSAVLSEETVAVPATLRYIAFAIATGLPGWGIGFSPRRVIDWMAATPAVLLQAVRLDPHAVLAATLAVIGDYEGAVRAATHVLAPIAVPSDDVILEHEVRVFPCSFVFFARRVDAQRTHLSLSLFHFFFTPLSPSPSPSLSPSLVSLSASP
jgi:hypothetical protein